MYKLPEIDKYCANCKYRDYDSFHDDLYCTHKPSPENTRRDGIVDNFGVCEYWEDYE